MTVASVIGSIGGFAIILANRILNTQLVTSVNRQSGIQFFSVGTYTWTTGDQSGPSIGGTFPWARPSGVGVSASQFDLFAHLISGTLEQGNLALDTWIPMGVAAPFYAVQGQIQHNAVIDFKFRNRSSGLQVGSSAQITIGLVPPA